MSFCVLWVFKRVFESDFIGASSWQHCYYIHHWSSYLQEMHLRWRLMLLKCLGPLIFEGSLPLQLSRYHNLNPGLSVEKLILSYHLRCYFKGLIHRFCALAHEAVPRFSLSWSTSFIVQLLPYVLAKMKDWLIDSWSSILPLASVNCKH